MPTRFIWFVDQSLAASGIALQDSYITWKRCPGIWATPPLQPEVVVALQELAMPEAL